MLTGYYQKNNKRFQKMLVKGTKFFLKKKKRVNIFVNNIEILQKTKNKGKLNIGNIILKCKRLIRTG